MKTSKRVFAGITGATAVASAAGMLMFGAGAAFAAAPPFEPDPSSVGTITFYNSAGQVITTGPTSSAPFAAYAVGSASPRAGDTQARVVFANPDPNSPPSSWYREAQAFNNYPVTTGPANIVSASQSSPTVVGDPGDQTLDGFESDSQISTTAGYQNVVQIRIQTANSKNQITTTYDDADLSINPTAHTWTQIYPAPSVQTTTVVTSSENPSVQGDNVTFTATETASDNTHPAGSVQFADGGTALGSPVAVDANGKATYATSTLAVGSHNITATFTTTASGYSGSSGSLTQTVSTPKAKSATALAVTQDGVAGDDIKLSATVTASGAADNNGTVSFYDNGSTTPLNSSPVSGTNGVYAYDIPTGLAAGSHSIVAVFTSSDPNTLGSSSQPQSFYLNAPAGSSCKNPTTGANTCTDPQNVQVTVPTGTITISTPYTASNPLDLGTMALNSTGTEFTANAPFNGITVTDTRSGIQGVNKYTVSALSSALTDGNNNPGSTINAENVGLTNLTAVNGNGFNGTTTGTDNPAADPAVAPGDTGSKGLGGTTPHTVFTATNSTGTVTVNGKLTINAPTSTEAGLFKGIITFTVG